MTETVACALCGADAPWVVFRHARTGIANNVCSRCGLAYLSPRPDAQAVADFYASFEQSYPDEALLRDDGAFARSARARADFASAHLPPGSTVWEVGCGYGHFLRDLARLGHEVHGLEPSSAQVEFVRRHFGLCTVNNGTFDLLPSDEQADLVASFHVLEHVRDPLAMLRGIRTALRPHGRVLLEVPNALLLPATLIEHLNVISGQHLFAYTPAVLEALLEAAGLRPLFVANEPLGVYPANLRVLAERVEARDSTTPAGAVEQARVAMERYHTGLAALGARIDALLRSWAGARVAIYGGGFHTRALLDLCDFSAVDLRCVVDDDHRKWGSALEGLPVRSQDAFEEVDAVLVSSLAAEPRMIANLEARRGRALKIGAIYQGARLPGQERIVYRDVRP